MIIMRLSVPIVYNFLELTHTEKAAAYVVMGPAKYVRFLGSAFNQWVFPVCLILMVIMTSLNIYGNFVILTLLGRLLNFIGLKQYSFNTEYAKDQVEEGKIIIEQYRKDKLQ